MDARRAVCLREGGTGKRIRSYFGSLERWWVARYSCTQLAKCKKEGLRVLGGEGKGRGGRR